MRVAGGRGGDIEDFLFLESARQKSSGRGGKEIQHTNLKSPYPVVRTDVTNNKKGIVRTFVLFEGEDEEEAARMFCLDLFSESLEECKEVLVELIEEKRATSAVTSENEKRNRKYCEIRLPEEADAMKLAERYLAVEEEGDAFRVHATIVESLFPSMKELGTKVGTDKVVHHGYHRFYERHLSGLRAKQIKILEIGLARGSSMNMWCGYFPGAEIFGIDITLHESCQPCKLGEGIYVFSGDTMDEEFVGGLPVEELDVIVDDGAHTPASQLSAFNFLFDKLKDGGVYMIEDIETSYWTRGELYGYKYGGGGVGMREGENIVEIFKNLADSVNREFFTDQWVHSVEYLSDEAVAGVASVEFGQNVIVITKRKGLGDKETYYERYYRMAENVEGYRK